MDKAFPQIPPEQVTPGQLLMILQSMHAQAAVHLANTASLKQEIEQLRADQRDLLEAWRTSRNVLRFVRLTAGFGLAVAGAWAAFKGLLSS
jgi:hypothetical protein